MHSNIVFSFTFFSNKEKTNISLFFLSIAAKLIKSNAISIKSIQLVQTIS